MHKPIGIIVLMALSVAMAGCGSSGGPGSGTNGTWSATLTNTRKRLLEEMPEDLSRARPDIENLARSGDVKLAGSQHMADQGLVQRDQAAQGQHRPPRSIVKLANVVAILPEGEAADALKFDESGARPFEAVCVSIFAVVAVSSLFCRSQRRVRSDPYTGIACASLYAFVPGFSRPPDKYSHVRPRVAVAGAAAHSRLKIAPWRTMILQSQVAVRLVVAHGGERARTVPESLRRPCYSRRARGFLAFQAGRSKPFHSIQH